MLRSGGPLESSDILNSELIRRLSEQRVTLRAQLAEQSSSRIESSLPASAVIRNNLVG